MSNGVKMVFVFGVLCCQIAQAQTADNYEVINEAPENAPVEVYGRANLGNGKYDSVLLKQQNEENPLGNPIVLSPAMSNNVSASQNLQQMLSTPSMSINAIHEDLPQNPKISPQETPQIVNKQIQNTLYESGGRIYDIQSYPASDVDEIEKPNLNKTVTTYPAY